MIAQLVFTPWEGKRLIAKAIASIESVRRAKNKGILFICRGTTNSYVLEELADKPIQKERYCAGMIPGYLCAVAVEDRIPEMAFIKGELVETTLEEIQDDMGEGDVFLKGGNILDLSGKAGVMLGSPTGGTIGFIAGVLYARGIEVIVPIGLEKLVMSPINDIVLQAGIKKVSYAHGMPVGVFPLIGRVISEATAIPILESGVKALHIGSGGVYQCSGGVTIQVEGSKEAVERIINISNSIKGEKPLSLPLRDCKTCNWHTCSWKGTSEPLG